MKSNRYSFNLTALTFLLKTPIVLFQRLTLPERWHKIRFAPLPWETGWFFIRKIYNSTNALINNNNFVAGSAQQGAHPRYAFLTGRPSCPIWPCNKDQDPPDTSFVSLSTTVWLFFGFWLTLNWVDLICWRRIWKNRMP